MRIFVHDYCGHPFQVQLSRALAARGHEVTHAYCASNPTTPKGALAPLPDDPESLKILPIGLPRQIKKGAFFDRWRLERLYGRRLASAIRAENPDVVLLANTPLDASAAALRECQARGLPLVYWLQDLIGEATGRILQVRLGPAGRLIGRHYRRMEGRILRSSTRVVGITDDFADIVARMGVFAARYTTIPNWAPLGEVLPRPRENGWSAQQGLNAGFVFLYSGTLGFKHNPGLLLALAKAFAECPEVYVVVNSQGDAADWLKASGEEAGLVRLRVNPYQPYEAMADVLGTADVLVCILEPDAGVFSVPSKVLSYHCAGRPLLLAVPEANLAARIVAGEATGLVADPGAEAAFVAAAQQLYGNADTRRAMGAKARVYAERNFDIEAISEKFEKVLQGAAGHADRA